MLQYNIINYEKPPDISQCPHFKENVKFYLNAFVAVGSQNIINVHTANSYKTKCTEVHLNNLNTDLNC